MKKILITLLFCAPILLCAQTKIKETAVPKSVLLTLERTYSQEGYKVKTWYQAPGQYIAEFVVDGMQGRGFFTAAGDWQYSAFPTKIDECPLIMHSYFYDNYPGYRIKSIDYIEEMEGDNYYRMIIVKKGVGFNDNEMIFDTRGKLIKSNAPDPAVVKREFYALNNPEAEDENNTTVAADGRKKKNGHRPTAVEDVPKEEVPAPPAAIIKDFEKRVPPARRNNKEPMWMNRGTDEFVAYYKNNQDVQFEMVYSVETEKLIKTGKVLPEERYTSAIKKYIDEKFKGEKYDIAKMVVYEYDAKYRGADGKKPKPYTYVVVSQGSRRKGENSGKYKFTRMEFDNQGRFVNLLAQPLDAYDVH